MKKELAFINNQDWEKVENGFFSSSPYNFVVIDNFLKDEVCTSVRHAIVNNKGWGLMNWQAEELFIRNFNLPSAPEIAKELKFCVPNILSRLSFVQHIAFMHHKNSGLCVHSDTGEVTLDIWLTPNQFNLDPDSGGLVFYNLKREESQKIHEFNARPWCMEYFEKNKGQGEERVAYAYNRAIIFDAKTFHASESMNFVSNGADTYRINYALLFDDSDKFKYRYESYR